MFPADKAENYAEIANFSKYSNDLHIIKLAHLHITVLSHTNHNDLLIQLVPSQNLQFG